MVKGSGDVILKVVLGKRPGRRLALGLPFLAVHDEDAGSVERSKDIAGKRTPYVVFTVFLLDMLKVSGMIDDMQPEEGDGHFVSRTIALVKRVPRNAASSTVGL